MHTRGQRKGQTVRGLRACLRKAERKRASVRSSAPCLSRLLTSSP